MANYYEILGVNRDATDADLKKAFHALAKKYHPDVNPGNTEAEAKFKEASHAYDNLSDANKRQQYNFSLDNPSAGAHGFNFNNGGGVPPGFEDLFSQIFGQMNGHRQRQKNRDIQVGLKISLEDSFNGKSELLKFNLPQGKAVNVMVEIPAGIESGVRIRYPGQGAHDNTAIPAGDLYVQIIIVPHNTFERSGNELDSRLEIDAIDAIIGSKIRFICIDNSEIDVTVPPGTQSGTIFRVAGHGMPSRGNKNRGNLILHAVITVPKNLSNDQLDILKNIQHTRNVEVK